MDRHGILPTVSHEARHLMYLLHMICICGMDRPKKKERKTLSGKNSQNAPTAVCLFWSMTVRRVWNSERETGEMDSSDQLSDRAPLTNVHFCLSFFLLRFLFVASIKSGVVRVRDGTTSCEKRGRVKITNCTVEISLKKKKN